MLVAKCNLLGWQISRETLAKIEAQIRWVSDFELLCLAHALRMNSEALFSHVRNREIFQQVFGQAPTAPRDEG